MQTQSAPGKGSAAPPAGTDLCVCLLPRDVVHTRLRVPCLPQFPSVCLHVTLQLVKEQTFVFLAAWAVT